MKKNDLDIGKMQPQAVELEEGVLGAILMDMDAISIVSDILYPASFYKQQHSNIYSAALSLYSKSVACDPLSVMQELKKSGELESVGGGYYLSELSNKMSFNFEFHARIIAQKFIQRELIRISTKTITASYDESADCFDLMDALEKDLTSINRGISTNKTKTIPSLWNDVAERNSILLNKKGLSGIASGYPNIDRITGGWQPSNLIIVAARPSMGKTALICNLARNASVYFSKPGAIFSLEMSARELATRMFAIESNLSIDNFTKNGIAEEQMIAVQDDCKKLINAPLYIDDTESLTIMELRSKARKLKREKKIEWLAVDYLQLMEGSSKDSKQNREAIISGVSRGLKSLAKELEIPVIALSQLSRAVESRGGDKRPQLSDLRESGAIEQDADIVIFIHRPEYYGQTEYGDGVSTEKVAEIIFAKNRNGAVGTEKLKYINYLTKFESFEGELKQPKLEPSKDFTVGVNKLNDEGFVS